MQEARTDQKNYLELRSVRKEYGSTVALDAMSFELSERERLAFLGPSGAGKTTTLKVIAGLEPLTSGEVYFKGKFINYLEPKDRNMAMVFESYVLYPHLSVFDNMASSLRVRPLGNRETIPDVLPVQPPLPSVYRRSATKNSPIPFA